MRTAKAEAGRSTPREVPAGPYLIPLRDALGGHTDPPIEHFGVGTMKAEIFPADNSLWIVIRRGRDEGGVALRAAFIPMAIVLDHQNKDMLIFEGKIGGHFWAQTRPLGDLYFAYLPE